MSKLIKEVLNSDSFDLLKSISSNNYFNNFYLCGGTALALQIGHRKSIDLDFFTQKDFSANIIEKIQFKYLTNTLFDNSIEIVCNSTKVMFMYFGFQLYKPLTEIEGIRIAHPIDIGLMKLLALEGRTSRKDIIDLYFLDQNIIKLPELLELFDKFYPKEKINELKSFSVILDSSAYIHEPMPLMLREINWDSAFGYVQQQILEYSKRKISS